MIKLFAIGNSLLGDDGIALYLLQKLQETKHLAQQITFFKAETDCFYALEAITAQDYVIILDSCHFNKPVGSLVCMPLLTCPVNQHVSNHSLNLMAELRLYYPEVQGAFIGIEIQEIHPALTLSPELERLIPQLTLALTNQLVSLLKL